MSWVVFSSDVSRWRSLAVIHDVNSKLFILHHAVSTYIALILNGVARRLRRGRYSGRGNRNFRSHVQKFLGAKVPESESSIYGTFVSGSESTWERKFHNL